MKKIYSRTKGIALIALLCTGITSTTFSQSICGPVAENFNNTSGSNAGFTGNFLLATDGSNSYLSKGQIIASAEYTITTPTYQLASNANAVGFGFTLGGTERVANVDAVIIYYSTFINDLVHVKLGNFVPVYGASTTASICRLLALSDLPGFPVGGKYRLQFELTSNTGIGGAGEIITVDDFRTNASLAITPLPVNFIGFEGKKSTSGVQLTWKVAGEENVNRYEVERSTDGRSFTTIASIPTTRKDSYTYFDANTNTTAYYRIKNVDNDQTFKYSSIVRITNNKSEIVIKAFPQPVTSNLTVQHPAGNNNGLITICGADGRVVKSVKSSTGSMQTIIDMNSLQKGIYLVKFDAGDGNVETIKTIKQ